MKTGMTLIISGLLCMMAIALFAQTEEVEMTEMELAYQKAVETLEKKEWEAARVAFEKALQLDASGDAERDRKVKSACWNNLGGLALRGDDLARGEEAFLKAIELDQSNALAHNNLAAVYLQRGDHNSALKEFQTALGVEPTNTIALHNIARLLIGTGQYQAAARLLLTGIRLTPNSHEHYELLSRVYRLAQRPEDAALLRQGWVEQMGGDANGLAHITRYYLAQGDQEQARAVAEILRTREPGWDGLSALEGQLAAAAGDNKKAISLLGDALRKATDDTLVRNDLITVLLRDKQIEEAARIALEGTEIQPEVSAIWYLSGLVQEDIGKREMAEEAYRKAVSLDGGHANAWRNLGVLAAARDEAAEAINCFEKALAADPFNRDNQFNLGYALTISRQDYERGVRMLGMLAANTRDEVGRKAMDFINRTHAAIAQDSSATKISK